MRPTATDRTVDRSPSRRHTASQWTDWLKSDQLDRGTDDPHPLSATTDGVLLLDLVAAVDYLTAGHRTGITVWDALEEALRRWLDEKHILRHGAPQPDEEPERVASAGTDPLAEAIDRLAAYLRQPGAPTAETVLRQAISRWAAAMAERYNQSYHWPHPDPRRPFPPPATVMGNS